MFFFENFLFDLMRVYLTDVFMNNSDFHIADIEFHVSICIFY